MNLATARIAAKWWAEHLGGHIPEDFIDRLTNIILETTPLPWGDIEYKGNSLSQIAPTAILPTHSHIQRINPWVVGVYDISDNKFDFLDPTGYLTKIAPAKENLLEVLLERVQNSTNIQERLRTCRILQALPLTNSADQDVLINLLQDTAQPSVLRYAIAQALSGGVYGNYDWVVPPIAEILNKSETDARLRYELRHLVGMLLKQQHPYKDTKIGQQITGVVLNRDESTVTLSDPNTKTYSYEDVPYWLSIHDTFSAYIFVVSFEPVVVAAFEPVPNSRRYFFICQHQRIDTLLLDDALPFPEADHQALEHAKVLAEQYFEPIFVFHAPAHSNNVPLRDVGSAGTEYAERDRLEDIIGVVYRITEEYVIIRIGGYNKLIKLFNPPDWLQNPQIVFSAMARYGPERDYLVILKGYKPLFHLNERDTIQYEIGERVVNIRFTGSMADADKRAIEQAKRLVAKQTHAVAVSHRVDTDRVRLLTVVENRQEVTFLSDELHEMNYWDF